MKKVYDPNNIRNVVVLGHQGSGKTSLIEALLFEQKVISKKGTVEEGTTVSDYTKEEKTHHVSYRTSVVPIPYEDEYGQYKYNFMDTPGLFDFVGEVNQALRAARSAILVIDATKGVEPGTKRVWKYLRQHSLPSIIYINKMDKENINFENLVEDIRQNLGKRAVPFTWPIGRKEDFEGFVNVVDMKARIVKNGVCVDDEIWEEKREKVEMLHQKIIESVADIDDEILEKFLMEEEIELQDVKKTLKRGIREGKLVPIICGSSVKNVGTHTLLRSLAKYLPSEVDMRQPFGELIDEYEIVERKVSDDEPLSAFVFKTDVDPFVGKLSYVVVRSGILRKDMMIRNSTKDVKERIGNLLVVRGKTQVEVDELHAGDIGVITKTNSLETNDTICDEKDNFVYDIYDSVSPYIFYSLEVASKNDEAKISDALRKMCIEDLTITANRDPELKQLILGCLGASHLEYIVEKLKNVYNISVKVGKAKIPYRETIKGNASVEGRYVKQSGGSGQYGIVQMRFEHCADSEEPGFVDDIFGGAVPGAYIPAVEKGFREACKTGVLAGYPVINIKATLFDGKYHPVDSSELAFKMAATLAFKDACPKARPTLLEPIYEVKVTSPNEYVGAVIGDINKRRGIIDGIEVLENDQMIIAKVPQSEMATYILDLNAFTAGQATFTMKFSHYQEVPEFLVAKVIEDSKRED